MQTSLYSRRLAGWFLTLALLVMALPSSSASWQCLDGTPCPAVCLMKHRAKSAVSSCAPDSSGKHCQMCPAGAVIRKNTASAPSSCTSSTCVLRISERAASTLQEGVKFFAPLLAMPPPAYTVVSPLPVEPNALVTAPILCFFPQRFLRPCLGRAPPVLL
jgi:hypothetical protein